MNSLVSEVEYTFTDSLWDRKGSDFGLPLVFISSRVFPRESLCWIWSDIGHVCCIFYSSVLFLFPLFLLFLFSYSFLESLNIFVTCFSLVSSLFSYCSPVLEDILSSPSCTSLVCNIISSIKRRQKYIFGPLTLPPVSHLPLISFCINLVP